ncbi:PAS domain-containing protein [Lysinibacillus sp. FSL K6-0232]|uniref:helix-turn-helix transcriptional regulator n=1 Tax=unclassified Lysinibacillus TaxID=2636778 RepID=UPI0030FA3D24
MNSTINPIFLPYLRMADAIYAIFDESCEVVVHDFSNMEKSLIYIKGNLTGRKLGAPITDFVLQQLKKDPTNLEDVLGTYSTTKDGVKIKSSIVYIKDYSGKVVGLFGINYNITQFAHMHQLLTNILMPFDIKSQINESYATSITEMFDQIIQTTLIELNLTLPISAKIDKVAFVQNLDKKGIFLVQGSTDKVADILNVTKQTIYNYLESE